MYEYSPSTPFSSSSSPTQQKYLLIIGACLILALIFFWMYQSSKPVISTTPTPTSTPTPPKKSTFESSVPSTPSAFISFETSSSSPAQGFPTTGTFYKLVGADETGNIVNTTIQTDKNNVKINGGLEIVNASGTRIVDIEGRDVTLGQSCRLIADAINLGRISSGDIDTYLDFISSDPRTKDFDARLIRNKGVNGDLHLMNKGTGSLLLGANGESLLQLRGSDKRLIAVGTSGAQGIGGSLVTSPDDSVGALKLISNYIEIKTSNGYVGVYWFTSDIRKKQNILPVIYDSSAIVEQIQFIEFDWKPESGIYGHVDLGVSAQQLQSLSPNLVTELTDGSLMVNEPVMITHLAKSLQEQIKEVKELRAENQKLKGQLSSIQAVLRAKFPDVYF